MTVTATNTPPPLAPGSKLDRYELLCPIAEGGMASVWVARMRGKHGFEKLFAIKTILPRYASDTRFREMFLDEARIASRIEHSNVAQIFDLGEEQGVLYLVMEYVDGDSLSKLYRSCQKRDAKIPTGIVLRVLADACAGLHEAHELTDGTSKPIGIVHRDISPHNILVSTRGIVKLIDFGIAKTGSPNAEGTDSGVLKGKIAYMAPEQALGWAMDRRADVWAVGAILYYLLAGKAPYDGDGQLATLHLLGAGLPPQPLAPEVHPAIAAVVRKALAYEPSKRHGTAADLRDAIERAMVVAQLTTTSAEISAFSTHHLADRAQRRREAIDHALTAAAERVRTGAAKAATPQTGEVPLPTTPPAASKQTSRPELPAAPTKPRALVSQPPPGASSYSYATLGSAALDASGPLDAPKPRKATLTVLAFVFGFAVVMGASLTALYPKRPAGAVTTAAGRAPMEDKCPPTSRGDLTGADLRGAAIQEVSPSTSGDASSAMVTSGTPH